MALINTLYLLFTLHFGLRGRITTSTMVHLRSPGKTRQSALCEKYRVQIPKKFEIRNDRCLVKIFRTYLAIRLTTWLLSTIHHPLFGLKDLQWVSIP